MRWVATKLMGFLARANRLPMGIKAVFAVAVLAALLVGAYGGGRFYDYAQNDPSFCRSCHTMEKAWTRWSTSEHSKVNCRNCHTSDIVTDMQVVLLYALERPDKVERHANLRDDVCKKCHESGNPIWRQVADTAGHQIHGDEQGIACIKCHSVTLHRFEPPRELCKVCHEDKTMKATKMAERYCLDCHNFLRANSPLRPTRETCLGCHQKLQQAKVTFPYNAPMKFACSDCHKPHESAAPVVNCASCHAGVKKEGLHKESRHSVSTCQTCHKPHDWKATSRGPCESCHNNKVSHNPGYVCKDCHAFKQSS